MRRIVLVGCAALCSLLAACGSSGNYSWPTPNIPPPDVPPPNGPMPAGTLQIAAVALRVTESQGNAEVSITRTAGSHGAVSVMVSTVDGTATAGQDYTAVNSTVTFADGDTTAKTVTIPVLDDGADEPDETFTVGLSKPTGGTALGAQATVTLTVEDNDPQLPPVAALLDLNLGIKQLQFSWPAVSGVTHYHSWRTRMASPASRKLERTSLRRRQMRRWTSPCTGTIGPTHATR